MSMVRTSQAALIAALLAAGTLTPLATTQAAVSVHFDSGTVAFGYADGYWDREHRWHHWPNAAARHEWRERNREHYYSHVHTHDRGGGWRENERWWGR
jgi:hypothetical protein